MPQSSKDSAGGKTHAAKSRTSSPKPAAKARKPGSGPTGSTRQGEKKTTP